jgi:hypothetical protein
MAAIILTQRFGQIVAEVIPNINPILLSLLNTNNTNFRFSIYNHQ